MKPGAVLVDVAIDQGGCFETSHATTHDDPVFEVDGIVHYCVANMPGAVPVTSTKALTNVTLPYARRSRTRASPRRSPRTRRSRRASTTLGGEITYQAVADAHGLPYTPLADALGAPRSGFGRTMVRLSTDVRLKTRVRSGLVGLVAACGSARS